MFTDIIKNSWQIVLSSEFKKKYFENLIQNVEEEYKNHICFPPKNLIFSALNCCDFNNLKVVIIGQDPYHGENEANGLCFSVNDNIAIPPSLRNIFKEINNDFGTDIVPSSGNLERLAHQGVLLLNSSLTVRKNAPNSHKHLHWDIFTDEIISLISDKKQSIIFLLWGNFAQQKAKLIDTNRHKILASGHPSPMSANQGKWFGNKHFSQTNYYLKSIGKSEINWL